MQWLTYRNNVRVQSLLHFVDIKTLKSRPGTGRGDQDRDKFKAGRNPHAKCALIGLHLW